MTSYTKEKPETIRNMFGSIAQGYDRGNAILSMGCHRYWNSALIKYVLRHQLGKCSGTLLDLCCGTGEIALGFLKSTQQRQEAFLLDFCPEMLAIAKEKGKKMGAHRIEYIEGDAQEIPLPAESVDCVTVAYGIRNVQSPERCAAEVHRVLRPGGRFGILELTRPKNPVMGLGHQAYLKTVLPAIGRIFLSNEDAYRYLCNSIQSFVSPDTLEATLEKVGFSTVTQKPLMGGVATLILADK